MTTISDLLSQSEYRRASASKYGFSGAHSDGYDYSDYQHDRDAWALRALTSAIGDQCQLHLAAAYDYREHIRLNTGPGERPTPRAKYIADHVSGQIDSALEVVCEAEVREVNRKIRGE